MGDKKEMNYLHRTIHIMLDLANISDEKGITPFDKEMGIGYRVFAPYIRKGVQEIISLEQEYYSMKESRDYAISCRKDNEEVMKEIFGDDDVILFNDEEKARVRAVVADIKKSWEEVDDGK